MTLAHCNAMLRVSKEGPPAGGATALKVSTHALQLWPSELGERFTTMKSEVVPRKNITAGLQDHRLLSVLCSVNSRVLDRQGVARGTNCQFIL